MLTELAAGVDIARLQANKTCQKKPEPMWFFKAGQTAQGKKNTVSVLSFLDGTQAWEFGGPEGSQHISRGDPRVQNAARHCTALMANKASFVARIDCPFGVNN